MGEEIEFEGAVSHLRVNKTEAGVYLQFHIPENQQEIAWQIFSNYRKRGVKVTVEPTTEPLGEHAD